MANRTRPKQIVIHIYRSQPCTDKRKSRTVWKEPTAVYHRSTYTVENCQSGRIERDIPRAEKTRKQSEPDSQEAE